MMSTPRSKNSQNIDEINMIVEKIQIFFTKNNQNDNIVGTPVEID